MGGSRRTPVAKEAGPVRIWLLGGFRVAIGDRPVKNGAWRLRKAAALVKLLALAEGHRLHREQAMDLLWPNIGKKAAANNLRNALHAARRVLDPAAGSHHLASEGDSLVLCPGRVLWVDVEAFEEAVLVARRSRDPAAHRAATETYAGDLLPEDRYEAWAEDRREELRRTYLALLVELSALHEEHRERGLAIQALREATAVDPTLEEAHASLMRLYALSGRPERALSQYERLRDGLARKLGTESTASTRRLRDEIAAGRLLPTASEGPSREARTDADKKHNLPAQRTSFVGREREMVEVKRTLSMTQLLTLTGAGGSGKTRLTLEVARDLAGAYPDGARVAELVPLSEPALVPQEVAGALGVQERPGEALTDTLTDALRDKELLLVLDNCEHVVEGAAGLVDALLESCPRLKVIATSREPLYVSGEVNWTVPPLSLPSESEVRSTESSTTLRLMRYEAVRLFADRARQRLPSFELTRENAGAVASVCRKLDGIPLAIELATARMGVLAVEQVAQRLDVSLDVLKGAGRSAAPRQHTMRATIDWSHDLLAEVEQRLFGRLSVFAGGWPLEAAEEVCSEDTIEHEDVLDLLGGLVDKSLVVAGAHEDGAVRYGMLEPLRQYAREKLAESGEAAEVRDRHATFFLALAEEAEPQLAGPGQRVWMERLEAEHDNLREALSWVLEQGEGEQMLRLGAALWRFWHVRGYLGEGISWMERVLGEGEPAASPARVKALEGMGGLTQFQGDYQRARAMYEEMLELSRELGDKGNVATALNSLGTVAAQRGDNERARALLQENLEVIEELEAEGSPAAKLKRFHAFNLLGYLAIYEDGDYARGTTLWEQSLALARKVEDLDRIGTTLANLGHPALLQRNYEKAKSLSEEALELAHELGSSDVEFAPTALLNLGLAERGLGEHERARGSFEEALRMYQTMGRTPLAIDTLEGMAGLAGELGKAIRAAHLWGAAEAAREVAGIPLTPGERALHEPYLASARSRLGEVAWEEALAKGQSMSLDEAVEYALAEDGIDRPAAPVPEQIPTDQPIVELTPRENEIAVLVGRGLTNRQIAQELSISERTAGNHVAKILKKLGLRSRAQVASWATETRLPASPLPDWGHTPFHASTSGHISTVGAENE